MSEYKKYFSNRSTVMMRPYEPGEEIRWVDKIHVSPKDGATGSPKVGDYIAHTLEKPDQEFLVSAENYKSYEVSNGDGGNAGRVAEAYDELKEARDPEGTNPQVRDPLLEAEAQAQAIAEAKADGDDEAATEIQQTAGVDPVRVETAKPDGEERMKTQEQRKEEAKEGSSDAPKEAPKPAPKEAPKPAVKEPPKFPHRK